MADLTFKNFAGVNRALDPNLIDDNQLETAKNVYPHRPGELALRPQSTLINSQGAVPNFTEDGVVFPFVDQDGLSHMITWMVGTSDKPDGGALYDYTPEFSFGSLLLTNNSTERPGFVAYNRKLYFFPAADAGGYEISFVGGVATVTALTGEWAASPSYRGNVSWEYQDSFVVAGYLGSEESTIRFTNVNEPGTLLTADKSDFAGRGDGDRIVGGVSVSVKGGADYVEPYSIVWKRHSTWIMRGVPPTSTLAGSISIMNLIEKEGLVAKETVVKTPHGLLWCSGENVWMIPTNASEPIPVANELRPFLLTLARGASAAWHAVYFKGFYRLTVPSSEALLVGGSASTYRVTPTEQWWLDMREFPKRLAWWGPMTRPCWASAVDYRIDTSPRLVECCTVNDAVNNVHLFIEGDTNTVGHDDAYNLYLSTASPGFEARFKEYDFDDPLSEKLIEKVELSAWADQATSLTVEMIGDGGDIVSIVNDRTGVATLSTTAPGFVLGTGILGTTRLAKKYDTLAGYPARGGRFRAKTWQPVVRFTPATVTTGRDIRIRALGAKARSMGRRNR